MPITASINEKLSIAASSLSIFAEPLHNGDFRKVVRSLFKEQRCGKTYYIINK